MTAREPCGLPVGDADVRNDDGDPFCCPGCREVHATLEGVDDVADVRNGAAAEPGATRHGDPPPGSERAERPADLALYGARRIAGAAERDQRTRWPRSASS